MNEAPLSVGEHVELIDLPEAHGPVVSRDNERVTVYVDPFTENMDTDTDRLWTGPENEWRRV